MTTGQLIALWYAALAVVSILLFKSLEGAYDNPYLIYAVITFAAALIYSMREHARANKKIVLVSVLMPFVTITCLGLAYVAWSDYQYQHQLIPLSPSKVQVQHFRIARLPGEILASEAIGRISNLSQNVLKTISLKFRFTGSDRKSPQYAVSVEALTAPGSTSDFSVPLDKQLNRFLDEPELWTGLKLK